MPQRRRLRRLAIWPAVLPGSLFLLLLLVLPDRPIAAAAGAADETAAGAVVLRGKVVCLDAESDRCNEEGARFELHTTAGERVGFLPEDPRAGIFVDPRVRERTLEIRGWRRDEGRAIEVLSVHSIVDGKPHHLHYRCDVCNITTSAPGPCWCCGAPFELREEPIDAGTSGAETEVPMHRATGDADRDAR